MTRDEVCTCAQYNQCCVCNKSRSNYAELMAEHELMKETLHLIAHSGSEAFRAACDQLAGIAQRALEEVEE